MDMTSTQAFEAFTMNLVEEMLAESYDHDLVQEYQAVFGCLPSIALPVPMYETGIVFEVESEEQHDVLEQAESKVVFVQSPEAAQVKQAPTTM